MSNFKMNEILKLRNETGCGMKECREAIEYAKTHDGCTPLGYLEAKYIAVSTSCSFEERVRSLSNG